MNEVAFFVAPLLGLGITCLLFLWHKMFWYENNNFNDGLKLFAVLLSCSPNSTSNVAFFAIFYFVMSPSST